MVFCLRQYEFLYQMLIFEERKRIVYSQYIPFWHDMRTKYSYIKKSAVILNKMRQLEITLV